VARERRDTAWGEIAPATTATLVRPRTGGNGDGDGNGDGGGDGNGDGGGDGDGDGHLVLASLRKVEAGRRREVELDGLRALALLAMMLYHGYFLMPGTWDVAWPWALRFDLSIEVFFVLSGYLIYGPFGRAHARGERPPGVGAHLLRRATRVYPAYWATVALMALLGWTYFLDRGQALAHLGLVQGYFPRDDHAILLPPGLGQSWTLVVEVSFYGFVPLWAWAMRRVASAARAVPRHVEVVGAVTVVLAGVAATLASAGGPLPPPLGVLPKHLTSLGWGMLLAVATTRGDLRTARPAWLRSRGRPRVPTTELCWVAAWGVTAVAAYLVPVISDDPGDLLVAQAANGLAAVLLVTPVVLGAATLGWVGRLLTWRPVVWLGLVSYGAYLWHLDLLSELPGPWVQAPFWPATGGMLVRLAAAVAAGAASWYLLERPLMRATARLLRRRRLDHPSRPPAPLPVPDHVAA
jgi:peptidoglycan/LPS O-acetylase OafA/YrhL